MSLLRNFLNSWWKFFPNVRQKKLPNFFYPLVTLQKSSLMSSCEVMWRGFSLRYAQDGSRRETECDHRRREIFIINFPFHSISNFERADLAILSGNMTGRRRGCEWKCMEKKCKQSQCARDGKLSIGNDNAVHSEKLSEIEMKIWFSKRRSQKKRSQTPVVRLGMKDEEKVTIK